MKEIVEKIKLRKYFAILILVVATLIISFYTVSEYTIDFRLIGQAIATYRYTFIIASSISLFILSIGLSKHVNRTFLLQLLASYVLYLFISYLLLFTRNLNNESFYIFGFQDNNFFEIGGWKVVVSIIGLAYIAQFISKRCRSLQEIGDFFSDKYISDILLALLTSLIVTYDSKLLENIRQFLYLDDYEQFNNFLVSIAYKVPTIVLTVTLIAFSFWNAFDEIRKNKSSVSLAFISSLFFALIFNFSIQFGIRADEDYLGEFIFPGATLFQIIMLALIFLIVYSIFNRYWASTLLILFSGIAISIANFLKFNLRNEPLLLVDFSMATELDLIFSFLDAKLFFMTILLLAFFIVVYYVLNKRFLKGAIVTSIKKRIFWFISVFSIFSGIITIFYKQDGGLIPNNIPVLSRLNNTRNIAFTGHVGSARYQSLMYVWIKQLTKPVMDKPENYNRATIEGLVEKYTNRATEINKTRDKNISDETLIFILSEGLSNPNRVKGVQLSENILKNIDEIKSKTTSGLMKSDAYGGGTANVEIQTLLGLPFYNLSSSVSIYNVEVVPKMKKLPSIGDSYLSDNRFVIHLGQTQLYSRADVYKRLKFDNFVADDKNALPPTINEKYGGFPSDASTYQNILDKIDTKESQFFSVITYQNHIPWMMDKPQSIYGTGEGFTELENARLTNYARLVNETDIVTKEFLQKLSKVDKKITVVFYGDHLPGFYPSSAFENKPESQYLTDYFIWSNHDTKKVDFPILNSSDFPAAVLAHTNSKVSPYYALLTDVLENASVDKSDLSQSQKEILEDLKLIQYDITAGKFYLKDYNGFFSIN